MDRQYEPTLGRHLVEPAPRPEREPIQELIFGFNQLDFVRKMEFVSRVHQLTLMEASQRIEKARGSIELSEHEIKDMENCVRYLMDIGRNDPQSAESPIKSSRY